MLVQPGWTKGERRRGANEEGGRGGTREIWWGGKGGGGGSSIVDEATHLPGVSCVYLNSASVQVNVAFDVFLDN